MAIRREKGRWVVDFRFYSADGRVERVRRASPVNTRRGAEEYERQLRTAMLEGTRRVDREVPTLAQFWPRWIEGHAKANRQKHSTIVSKESILRNHLVPALGTKRLDAITAEDVARLKGRLKGHSPKTANNILSVLSTLLKTAIDWQVIREMPRVELLKVTESEMAFFEEAEFEALVRAAAKVGPQHFAMVLLAGEAGLRAGEIMALRWVDVDLKRAMLTIRRTVWRGVEGTTKGGKERKVGMTARLVAALQAIRHLRGPRVFYRVGGRTDGKPPTQKTLQVWMEAVERRAGMEVTGKIHILRHTFCSRLAMRGAPAKAIQELAGHVHLSTTQRYMHLSPAWRDGAIRLLEGGDPNGSHLGAAKEGDS